MACGEKRYLIAYSPLGLSDLKHGKTENGKLVGWENVVVGSVNISAVEG